MIRKINEEDLAAIDREVDNAYEALTKPVDQSVFDLVREVAGSEIVLLAPSPVAAKLWDSALMRFTKCQQLIARLCAQVGAHVASVLASQTLEQASTKYMSNPTDVELDKQKQPGDITVRATGNWLNDILKSLDSQLSVQLDTDVNIELESRMQRELWGQLDNQLSGQIRKDTVADVDRVKQSDDATRAELIKMWRPTDTKCHDQLDQDTISELESRMQRELWDQMGRQLSGQIRRDIGRDNVKLAKQPVAITVNETGDRVNAIMYPLDKQSAAQMDKDVLSALALQTHTKLWGPIAGNLSRQVIKDMLAASVEPDKHPDAVLINKTRAELTRLSISVEAKVHEQLDKATLSELASKMHKEMWEQMDTQLARQIIRDTGRLRHWEEHRDKNTAMSIGVSRDMWSKADTEMRAQTDAVPLEVLENQMNEIIWKPIVNQLEAQISTFMRNQANVSEHQIFDACNSINASMNFMLRSQLADPAQTQVNNHLVECIEAISAQLDGMNAPMLKEAGAYLHNRLGSELLKRVADPMANQLVNQLAGQLEDMSTNLDPMIVEALKKVDASLNGQLHDMNEQLIESTDKTTRIQLGRELLNMTDPVLNQLASELTARLQPDSYYYCSLYWLPWATLHTQAKIAGVVFPAQCRFEAFQKFARNVHFCIPRTGWCIVSEKPTKIVWDDSRNFLHNDTGPSVQWSDGFAMWTIDGVAVDEQIVMRPQTQTIQQMNDEPNNDVRSIRIERYGWEKYLIDSKSELLDQRKHPREGTNEYLYQDPLGRHRFIGSDPATGKLVSLAVDRAVKTCRDAQAWMSHGTDAYAMCRD